MRSNRSRRALFPSFTLRTGLPLRADRADQRGQLFWGKIGIGERVSLFSLRTDRTRFTGNTLRANRASFSSVTFRSLLTLGPTLALNTLRPCFPRFALRTGGTLGASFTRRASLTGRTGIALLAPWENEVKNGILRCSDIQDRGFISGCNLPHGNRSRDTIGNRSKSAGDLL